MYRKTGEVRREKWNEETSKRRKQKERKGKERERTFCSLEDGLSSERLLPISHLFPPLLSPPAGLGPHFFAEEGGKGTAEEEGEEREE